MFVIYLVCVCGGYCRYYLLLQCLWYTSYGFVMFVAYILYDCNVCTIFFMFVMFVIHIVCVCDVSSIFFMFVMFVIHLVCVCDVCITLVFNFAMFVVYLVYVCDVCGIHAYSSCL